MLQNLLLFTLLKMLKTGYMLNVIQHCNNLCIACYSVGHRTTTVHLVIFMRIMRITTLTSSVGILQLTAWLAAQWCGLVVTCNVQHIVTNHTEGQISQNEEQHCLLPSLGDDFTCIHPENALLTHILSTLFSSTSVLFSCTPFSIWQL